MANQAANGSGMLYYVYIPNGKGLVLYTPSGMDRPESDSKDCGYHLFCLKTVRKCSRAFIVKSDRKKMPNQVLSAEDFNKRRKMALVNEVEL